MFRRGARAGSPGGRPKGLNDTLATAGLPGSGAPGHGAWTADGGAAPLAGRALAGAALATSRAEFALTGSTAAGLGADGAGTITNAGAVLVAAGGAVTIFADAKLLEAARGTGASDVTWMAGIGAGATAAGVAMCWLTETELSETSGAERAKTGSRTGAAASVVRTGVETGVKARAGAEEVVSRTFGTAETKAFLQKLELAIRINYFSRSWRIRSAVRWRFSSVGSITIWAGLDALQSQKKDIVRPGYYLEPICSFLLGESKGSELCRSA